MRSVSTGVVALALAAMAIATPARAADITPAPSYYPPAAPLPPAMYNWTGIYAGGNVGGGLLSDSISQASTTKTTTNIPGTQTAHPAGIIGGAQLGANYQFDRWVIGAEAAWSASNLSGYGIGSTTFSPVAKVSQERNTSNPLWLTAVSGRLGYAVNDVLLYAKGGGAWMHVQYIQDLLATGSTVNSQTLNVNRSGFVAGGGIEYGLTENLSARLEYDFYDFGTETYHFAATPVNNTSYLHTLTFGLDFRFTPSPSGQWSCPTC